MTTTSTRRSLTSPAPEAANRSGTVSRTPGYDDEFQDDLVLPGEGMGMATENLAERVQMTQQRLSSLRAEAEALEREKQQFEELSRAIAMLDRESYESQKRVEQFLTIKDSFHQHLDTVQAMNPEEWDPQALPHDLSRAIGIIEDAREEYAKAMSRVQMLTASGMSSTSSAAAVAAMPAREFAAQRSGLNVEISRDAFRSWAFCGAAFSLPLIVCAVLYMLVRLITG